MDTIVSLIAGDCYIDCETVAEAIATWGMVNVIHNEWIIKWASSFARPTSTSDGIRPRRVIDAGGIPPSVVAPEDLILSRLLWARETGSELQRSDVQELLAAGLSR